MVIRIISDESIRCEFHLRQCVCLGIVSVVSHMRQFVLARFARRPGCRRYLTRVRSGSQNAGLGLRPGPDENVETGAERYRPCIDSVSETGLVVVCSRSGCRLHILVGRG